VCAGNLLDTYVRRKLIGPGRPVIGLPGDKSRVRFAVGIFRTSTLGQNLAGNQFGEEVPKTLDLFRETRPVWRVRVDPIPLYVWVVVVGKAVGVRWLSHIEGESGDPGINAGGVPGCHVGPSRHAAGRVRRGGRYATLRRSRLPLSRRARRRSRESSPASQSMPYVARSRASSLSSASRGHRESAHVGSQSVERLSMWKPRLRTRAIVSPRAAATAARRRSSS
jgi:hypothetical protein